jgi:Carboxypeptidase regulatory-like domain
MGFAETSRDISMRRTQRSFCVIAAVCASLSLMSHAASQTKSMIGTVTDAQTNQPVHGTLVFIKDKPDLKAISAPDGNFKIKHVPSGIYTVVTQDERYLPTAVENCDFTAPDPAQLKLQLYSRKVAFLNGKLFMKVPPSAVSQTLKSAKIAGDDQTAALLANTLALYKSGDSKIALEAAKELGDRQSAGVFGALLDKNGESIHGVTLIFVEVNTGFTFSTKPVDGHYAVSLLPGDYEVKMVRNGATNTGDLDTVPLDQIRVSAGTEVEKTLKIPQGPS